MHVEILSIEQMKYIFFQAQKRHQIVSPASEKTKSNNTDNNSNRNKSLAKLEKEESATEYEEDFEEYE